MQLLLPLLHVFMLFFQCVVLDATNSLMRLMWMTPIQVYSLLHESTCNSHEDSHYIDHKTSDKPFSVTETQLNRIKIALSNYYKYFISNPPSFSTESSKAATRSDLFYLFQQQTLCC